MVFKLKCPPSVDLTSGGGDAGFLMRQEDDIKMRMSLFNMLPRSVQIRIMEGFSKEGGTSLVGLESSTIAELIVTYSDLRGLVMRSNCFLFVAD